MYDYEFPVSIFVVSMFHAAFLYEVTLFWVLTWLNKGRNVSNKGPLTLDQPYYAPSMIFRTLSRLFEQCDHSVMCFNTAHFLCPGTVRKSALHHDTVALAQVQVQICNVDMKIYGNTSLVSC